MTEILLCWTNHKPHFFFKSTCSIVSSAGPGVVLSYTGSTFSDICLPDLLHFCLQPQTYPKRKNRMEVRKNTDIEDTTASVTASSIDTSLFAVVLKLHYWGRKLSIIVIAYPSGRYQQDEVPNFQLDCKPWCKQFQDEVPGKWTTLMSLQ